MGFHWNNPDYKVSYCKDLQYVLADFLKFADIFMDRGKFHKKTFRSTKILQFPGDFDGHQKVYVKTVNIKNPFLIQL